MSRSNVFGVLQMGYEKGLWTTCLLKVSFYIYYISIVVTDSTNIFFKILLYSYVLNKVLPKTNQHSILTHKLYNILWEGCAYVIITWFWLKKRMQLTNFVISCKNQKLQYIFLEISQKKRRKCTTKLIKKTYKGLNFLTFDCSLYQYTSMDCNLQWLREWLIY